MKASFVRAAVMALSMSSVLSVTAPAALAQTQAANTGVTQTAEGFAACQSAMVHFNLYEIMEFGAMQGLSEDERVKSLPAEDQTRLYGLVREELRARRDQIITGLAQANCPNFTDEQTGLLLRLSQVDLLRQVMWFGADPSRPEPDLSQLSAEDGQLLEQVGNEEWFNRFMGQMDMSPARDLLEAGILAGFERFAAN